jgi:hypothetical protein
LGQSHYFIEVEEPALAPHLPAGRSFRRRGSIHRHSAVRHRKRQERSEDCQSSRRRRPSKATSHQIAEPARDVCRSDRCHWPTPEPRSDVVPPRSAVAFQRPTFHGAPRLQPHLGDHTQRRLASTRVQPLTRPQPPPLILLPCHRIRLAVEHPRGDLPAIRFDAGPVADLAFRCDLALDTHRAGASRFASSQAVRASSSQRLSARP